MKTFSLQSTILAFSLVFAIFAYVSFSFAEEPPQDAWNYREQADQAKDRAAEAREKLDKDDRAQGDRRANRRPRLLSQAVARRSRHARSLRDAPGGELPRRRIVRAGLRALQKVVEKDPDRTDARKKWIELLMLRPVIAITTPLSIWNTCCGIRPTTPRRSSRWVAAKWRREEASKRSPRSSTRSKARRRRSRRTIYWRLRCGPTRPAGGSRPVDGQDDGRQSEIRLGASLDVQISPHDQDGSFGSEIRAKTCRSGAEIGSRRQRIAVLGGSMLPG